jgi:hypothetical protein
VYRLCCRSVIGVNIKGATTCFLGSRILVSMVWNLRYAEEANVCIISQALELPIPSESSMSLQPRSGGKALGFDGAITPAKETELPSLVELGKKAKVNPSRGLLWTMALAK